MFCPYCQKAVEPSETSISGDDHRWCFVHLYTKGVITGNTPEENRASWIAICTAHKPPKAKVENAMPQVNPLRTSPSAPSLAK